MTTPAHFRCTSLSGLHLFIDGRCRACRYTEAYIAALEAAHAKYVTPALEGDRDGVTFDHDRDAVRLNAQMQRVFAAMADGRAHTPKELEALTGDEWASVSARVRDLRKPKFGGHEVVRESLGGGLFAYRLVTKEASRQSA